MMVASPNTLPDEKTESRTHIEAVRLYKVIFLDDAVTTFDFVVKLLMTLFKKERSIAVKLTLEVHHTKSSHVATLPREQAELRQTQVHDAARKAGFPFRCIIEPE
jgi:ATP-dependent Clp protease adaptor protein ClpS